MTPYLFKYLCDPISKQDLELLDAEYSQDGLIISGKLKSSNGTVYPIIDGIPRFINNLLGVQKSVEAFGDEWNYFNFTDFKLHWLNHTVANTFGGRDIFKDKIIVDAGGGSGSQTLWMLESGAKHVIMLELSHSVDGVVKRNLASTGYTNYDVVQCSIDSPPIKDRSIDGMVICHNVIQHTPSVKKTARALYSIVAPGGEFVFNCYNLNDRGLLRWVRFHLIYTPLRFVLSRVPFAVRLLYSWIMGGLRLIPVLGKCLELANICVQGDVPHLVGEGIWSRLKRRFKATALNTFDGYGGHLYQHHLRDDDLKKVVISLQPDVSKIGNYDKYFSSPPPIGCALRLQR